MIGLPHPALGEEVGAVVALKPGAVIRAEELRDYVKGQVAAYKYPRHVWIVDTLPIGPTGKILKRRSFPQAGIHSGLLPRAGLEVDAPVSAVMGGVLGDP